MANFSVGSKVILIDTNTRGVVVEVKPPRRGRQIYRVSFQSGTTDVLEPDLRTDFDETDPFDCCKSGLFGSYSDFSKINTTFKIQNSNNSTISSLKASKTIFKPYQFKPLLKFLNSPTRRILVADEVGLGLSKRYKRSQLKAAVKVNSEMLRFYWSLGKDIVGMHAEERWGEGFMICLSRDMKREISDATSFSTTNLYYIKKFYLFYCEDITILPQLGVNKPDDNKTIGLLICKTKDQVLARYALESSSQPLAVSEYELEKFYPQRLEGIIPSIDEIERHLEETTKPDKT